VEKGIRLLLAALFVGATLAISGCGSTGLKLGSREMNPEFAKPEFLARIDQIEKGMSSAEVYQILGIKPNQSNFPLLDSAGVQGATCGNCRFDPKDLAELKEHEQRLADRTGRRLIIVDMDEYVSIKGASLVERETGAEMGLVFVFDKNKLIVLRPDGDPHADRVRKKTLFGLLYDVLIRKGLITIPLMK